MVETPILVKVSKASKPAKVAGAIAGIVRNGGSAEVRSIGPTATNQAAKAIALATMYLEGEGMVLRVAVRFQVIPEGELTRPISAISFTTYIEVVDVLLGQAILRSHLEK